MNEIGHESLSGWGLFGFGVGPVTPPFFEEIRAHAVMKPLHSITDQLASACLRHPEAMMNHALVVPGPTHAQVTTIR